MLVIGSVAVSREGHHIGKGNGYVDLDFGILAERGIITKDTLIVTTVHDIQVIEMNFNYYSEQTTSHFMAILHLWRVYKYEC